MQGKMKAALKVEAAPGAKIALVDIPRIGSRDVLVQVKAASICGTDMHIYDWDAWAQSRMTVPRIFGHEFAGEVVEVGDEVTSLVPGDFVAAETHITCGQCYQCRTGQAHVCRNVQILGVDRDGAFAEYIAIPERWPGRQAKKLTIALPRFKNPLATPFTPRLPVRSPTKLSRFLAAAPSASGRSDSAVSQAPAPFSLLNPIINAWTIATTMGADYAINPTEVDPVEKILDVTDGLGVDVVLEMSGHPQAIRQSFKSLRFGGRVSLLGIPSRTVEFDLANDIIFKGATVYGISGRLHLRYLVSYTTNSRGWAARSQAGNYPYPAFRPAS